MIVPRRWRLPLKLVSPAAGLMPLPDPDDVRRFVILSTPRSGTTWVIDLLNSHKDVTCFSELFAHDYFGSTPDGGMREVVTWDSYATLRLPGLGRLQRFLLYFRYLDEEIFNSRYGSAAVGFKLMYPQVQRGFGILAYLKVREVGVVHLIRHNHLDALLSEEGRKARNYFHAAPGAKVAPVRLTVESPTLTFRLEQRDAMIREAREFYSMLGVPYLELAYEDLLSDRDRIGDVLQFLGVRPASSELDATVQKLNPSSHRDIIANYDEIRDALRNTRFAELLH